MRLLVRLSGLVLFVLAVAVLNSSQAESAFYLAGVALVLLSSKSHSAIAIKLLASSAALLMFVYFFLPFIETSYLGESSIGQAGALFPMIAAFAIMPLVAQLTCRMKAGQCGKAYLKSQNNKLSPIDAF